MKNISFIPFLSCLIGVSLASGCQEAEQPDVEKTSDILLGVRASCLDFAEMGQEQEAALSGFSAGDTIGVFGLDKDGSVLSGCRNAAFVYDGSSEWKGNVYYYEDAVYFAYFPYSKSLSPLKSVHEIEEAFADEVRSTTDQSTFEAFRSCDLMVAENVVPSDGVLDFRMSRRMSMVEIAFPEIEYRTSADSEPYYSASIGSLAFEVNDIAVKPYMADKGVYRYIVVPENNLIYGEYKVAGDWADYGEELVFIPGKYKRIDVVPDNTVVIHDLSAGDFFLKSGAILPKDTDLTASEQEECIGVVFWTGDPTASDATLKKDFPGCTHGLVVALDEIASNWSAEVNVKINDWLEANAPGYLSINTEGDGANTDKVVGYNNTMAIDHYNNNGLAESADVAVAVEKTMEYRSSNSLECDASGWYLPSIKELCLLYKGNTNIWTAANNVAEEINASIEKVGGATVLTGDYWSSTEAGTGSAHRIEASGKVTGTRMFNSYKVRPVTAF